MKTEDLIQLGALVAIGYMAYQKFGKPKSPATIPTTSSKPYVPPVDFGVTNPDDSSWGDSTGAQSFVDQIIQQAGIFSL